MLRPGAHLIYTLDKWVYFVSNYLITLPCATIHKKTRNLASRNIKNTQSSSSWSRTPPEAAMEQRGGAATNSTKAANCQPTLFLFSWFSNCIQMQNEGEFVMCPWKRCKKSSHLFSIGIRWKIDFENKLKSDMKHQCLLRVYSCIRSHCIIWLSISICFRTRVRD